MDFAALAAYAVTVIAPFVPDLWKGVAEKTGGAAADASFAIAKQVYHLVAPSLLQDSEARSSLDVLADNANDVAARDALSVCLMAEMRSNPHFAEMLKALLESNGVQSSSSQIILNHGATIGKQVIISSVSGEGTINLT